MSRTKHTPGPWILTPREGSDTTDIVSSCEHGWEIATVIGGINDSFTEAGSAESIANAKLIAAAPDMYEAIQCALNLKDLWSAQQHGTISADHAGEMEALKAMQDKLEAALQKATT